jgi:hypothetical protein
VGDNYNDTQTGHIAFPSRWAQQHLFKRDTANNQGNERPNDVPYLGASKEHSTKQRYDKIAGRTTDHDNDFNHWNGNGIRIQ